MIAWAISGGNTKGGISIGMGKRLVETEGLPNTIVGTSVGAINAALIRWHGIEGAEELWRSLESEKQIFKFNWSSLLLLSRGLYSLKPLRSLLVKYLSGEPMHPYINSYATCVDLITGEVKYFKHTHPNYIDYIIASSSEPLFMEPLAIDGGYWSDGGSREFVPVDFCAQLGAKKIHALIHQPAYKEETFKPGRLINNGWRAIELLQVEIFQNDIVLKHHCEAEDIELHVYRPETIPIGRFDLNPEAVNKSIEIGYAAVA